MDPAKHTHFCDSFCSAAEENSKGVSTIIITATNGHWDKWASFFRKVALDPLPVSYRDSFPILNTFSRQYRTGSIASSGRQLLFYMVEGAIQSIGQVLNAPGTTYLFLTSHGSQDVRVRFQFQCYIKKNTPPSRVKLTPLQFLQHILSVSNASGDPTLQAKFNIIIVAYLFLLLSGDYTGSKYYIPPFCLEDVTFSCGRSVFAETSTETNAQSTTFVTLTFTTQKKKVRGMKIGHKASCDPTLCTKSALLWSVLHLRANNAPLPPRYPTS